MRSCVGADRPASTSISTAVQSSGRSSDACTEASRNSRPRSRGSSGFLLGLDVAAAHLLSPGQHPGIKVSAKSAQAHCLGPLLCSERRATRCLLVSKSASGDDSLD